PDPRAPLAQPAGPAEGPAQEQVLALGRRIEQALGQTRSPAARLDDALMRAAAGDEHLRRALFRFIDVRPACRTRRELGEHLTALLGEEAPASGPGRVAAALARGPLTRSATAVAAGLGVQRVARRFIVGSSVEAALANVAALWRTGVGSSLDLLGEESVSAAEADAYARRCVQTLRALARASRSWPARRVLEADAI